MPTPESAAFLAKKPTVPPTYDGVDYEDNVAVHNARDAIIREQWVRSMMARLVGEELGKCYHREGVNHFEKCGALRGEFYFAPASSLEREKENLVLYELCLADYKKTERYFELLKDRKVKGYLFEEKNYFAQAGEAAKSL
jgi:hypothetical protein